MNDLTTLADRLHNLHHNMSLHPHSVWDLQGELRKIEAALRQHAADAEEEEQRTQKALDRILSDEPILPPQGKFIPGLKAIHAVITPQCRRNRGNQGAIGEAFDRVLTEYRTIVNARKDEYQFHLVLMVEKLPAPPSPDKPSEPADPPPLGHTPFA